MFEVGPAVVTKRLRAVCPLVLTAASQRAAQQIPAARSAGSGFDVGFLQWVPVLPAVV
jgi:hypothetical protein